MNSRIPEALQVLIGQMAQLPGLGPKSAMRAAMALLKWPEDETRRLGKNIYSLRDELHLCEYCGALSDQKVCGICADPGRDDSLLCVTADWDSMLALEDGAFFRGRYFILGGLPSPLDNTANVELDRLTHRLSEGQVREVILALGSTLEAENAGELIRSFIGRRFPNVRVSRLAQGIPLGAEVRFMDHETLRQSLKFRQLL